MTGYKVEWKTGDFSFEKLTGTAGTLTLFANSFVEAEEQATEMLRLKALPQGFKITSVTTQS